MIERRNALLNSVGAGFWLAGFILAAMRIYPYAFIGIYLGPLLLLLGSIGWLRRYRKEHGIFPNPIRSFKRTVEKKGILQKQIAALHFLISHLLVIGVIMIHFWVILTFVGVAMIKRSNAYQAAVERVALDAGTGQGVGRVIYFGFLAGGTIGSEGTSRVTFTAVGEKGTKEVHATVETRLGRSQVVSIDYR